MRTIGMVDAFCDECGWMGKVHECEPDIDGDGSLGCPKCNTVVEALMTKTEKKIREPISANTSCLILLLIMAFSWACGSWCMIIPWFFEKIG